MEDNIGTTRLLSFSRAQRETVFGKEFLNIGPTPCEEDCTQVGTYPMDSMLECLVYIKQLKRCYGESPMGCEFFVMRNEHDFGSYYDVNIFYKIPSDYNESPNECEEYALKVESGIENWDETSLQELRAGNHHLHITKVISMKKSA